MVRELPAYEPPHLPLHTSSADTLSKLTTSAPKIPTYLTEALTLLTAAACDAHETHTATTAPTPGLAALLEKLDASARTIADATTTHSLANRTLTTLTTLEKQRARRVRDDAEDSDSEDAANIDTVPVADGVWARYSTAHDAACEQYAALPNAEKYPDEEGDAAPYYEYRKTIWELQHADDGAPLPSARAWFAGMADDGGEEGESDDELAVAQEKRSFRCPLSMREFTHPMKSTLCPHTFDKDAIEGYLMVRGRPTGEKDCPMPGCEQRLSMRVMKEDLGLLRVMKRQKEKERERREREVLDRESGEEEEEEEEDEAEEWAAAGTQVKGEKGVAVKKEKVLKRRGRERTVNVSDDESE